MASVSRRDSYGDKKTRPCGCGGNTGAWCHWTSSWLETFLPWWRTGIACRHSIFSPPEAGTTPLTVWSHSQTAGSSLWQCFSIIIWLPGDVLSPHLWLAFTVRLLPMISTCLHRWTSKYNCYNSGAADILIFFVSPPSPPSLVLLNTSLATLLVVCCVHCAGQNGLVCCKNCPTHSTLSGQQ